MKAFSKTAKTAVILGTVLLALAAVMIILLLTAPKSAEEISFESAEQTAISLTKKQPENILSFSITNENGSFSFSRQESVSANEDGELSKSYYWTSGELLSVGRNDSAIKDLAAALSEIKAESLVEENADDLEKYGLSSPKARAVIKFDDGTSADLSFGLENAAAANSVYCSLGDNNVYSVSRYDIKGVFGDIKDFANLLITKNLGAGENVESVVINRRDLDFPVEIRFMSEVDEARNDEKITVSTFNTHRFTSPVYAEVDNVKGAALYQKVCAITMESCAYLEQSEENLKKCGLFDPFCVVEFSYGGEQRRLCLGDAVKKSINTGVEGAPELFETTGCYAFLAGVPGIFILSIENAPWYNFDYAQSVSSRAISPYIYSIKSIEIAEGENVYTFLIDGENESFSCEGKELSADNFKKFYQTLVGAFGEEVYIGEAKETAEIIVKFTYKDEYQKLYGGKENIFAFYPDGEKLVFTLDGKSLFRVKKSYVELLKSNVKNLLSGEAVSDKW